MLLCATLRVRLPLQTRCQYRGGRFTLDCINVWAIPFNAQSIPFNAHREGDL